QKFISILFPSATTAIDLLLNHILPIIFLLIVYFMAGLRQSIKHFFFQHAYCVSMYHCCSGIVANWCFTDGHQEGNHSSFSDSHDLYVGWWILCAGKHCRAILQGK
ncbi:hypothetical protein BHE74_00038545, partial [Ensete ventricosum]